jgi:hypothetical protein
MLTHIAINMRDKRKPRRSAQATASFIGTHKGMRGFMTTSHDGNPQIKVKNAQSLPLVEYNANHKARRGVSLILSHFC